MGFNNPSMPWNELEALLSGRTPPARGKDGRAPGSASWNSGGDGPAFFFAPVRRHGSTSEFDLSSIDTLPRVELTYSYPGGSGHLFDPKPAGVVVATTGMTREESAVYRTLRSAGVVVVTAFPSGDNITASRYDAPPPADTARPPVTERDSIMRAERTAPREVVAQHLLPQKARILLMVALTRTRDPREIQRMFREY